MSHAPESAAKLEPLGLDYPDADVAGRTGALALAPCSALRGLRRVFAWYDALSQSEKDEIRAEARAIVRRAAENTQIRIALFEQRACTWQPYAKPNNVLGATQLMNTRKP